MDLRQAQNKCPNALGVTSSFRAVIHRHTITGGVFIRMVLCCSFWMCCIISFSGKRNNTRKIIIAAKCLQVILTSGVLYANRLRLDCDCFYPTNHASAWPLQLPASCGLLGGSGGTGVRRLSGGGWHRWQPPTLEDSWDRLMNFSAGRELTVTLISWTTALTTRASGAIIQSHSAKEIHQITPNVMFERNYDQFNVLV